MIGEHLKKNSYEKLSIETKIKGVKTRLHRVGKTGESPREGV